MGSRGETSCKNRKSMRQLYGASNDQAKSSCGRDVITNSKNVDVVPSYLTGSSKRLATLNFNRCQQRQMLDQISLLKPGQGWANRNMHVQFINKSIGHGVFASEELKEHTFIGTYPGDMISKELGKAREILYAEEKNGCFVFHFNAKPTTPLREYLFENYGVQFNKAVEHLKLCLDPTNGDLSIPDNKMAMLNHSKHKRNLKHYLAYSSCDLPHLVFFTCKTISKGSELFYDYNDDSPDAPDWMSS